MIWTLSLEQYPVPYVNTIRTFFEHPTKTGSTAVCSTVSTEFCVVQEGGDQGVANSRGLK
jgi:hypothetical protein